MANQDEPITNTYGWLTILLVTKNNNKAFNLFVHCVLLMLPPHFTHSLSLSLSHYYIIFYFAQSTFVVAAAFFILFPFIHLILFNVDVASILICCVEKFLSCVHAYFVRFTVSILCVVVLRQCASIIFFFFFVIKASL